jgi:Kef-type K+ transport system membrane component KefB
MYVPLPTAWVMFGEIGYVCASFRALGYLTCTPTLKTISFIIIIISLILLVIEAGIDIDLDMLKLIGTRGFLIAVVGSFLPIGIGIAVAFALGNEPIAAIAAGAAFGPTSLGIALNILRGGGILNTPVGQLVRFCGMFVPCILLRF